MKFGNHLRNREIAGINHMILITVMIKYVHRAVLDPMQIFLH